MPHQNDEAEILFPLFQEELYSFNRQWSKDRCDYWLQKKHLKKFRCPRPKP